MQKNESMCIYMLNMTRETAQLDAESSCQESEDQLSATRGKVSGVGKTTATSLSPSQAPTASP